MIFKFLSVFLLVFIYNASAQSPNCYMPTGQLGYCVSISQCSFIRNILNAPGNRNSQYRATEILRRFACGSEQGLTKVCCNQYENFVPSPPDVSRHENLQLLENDCGTYSSDKIVDGENTHIFEFPWMALLSRMNKITKNLEFFCGGTIIHKRYILTAAHCVYSFPRNYKFGEVRVGEHDTNTLYDCQLDSNSPTGQICAEGFQTFRVEEFIIHEYYSPNTFANDIALLRLKSDIDFTHRNVKSICLPIGAAARLFEQTAFVSGWGRTKVNALSSKLLKAAIPIVPMSECARTFNMVNYTQICAGGRGSSDSCTGDSGGPLQNVGTYFNQLRFIQYGIVSYGGKDCGVVGVPAVYTSVAYYVDWILNYIRN